MFERLTTLVLFLVVVLPPFLAAAPFILLEGTYSKLAWLVAAPPVYVIAYVLVCGLFARLGVSGIKPGTFPRDPKHPVYGRRKLFGASWTAIYYNKPLYWLILSTAPLKRLTFSLFGYRGAPDFTVYPDSWIRDLPLLFFGSGSYISNRSTLGTNIVLNDGDILVDGITIGQKALVGHLAMVGAGARVGDESEIGLSVAIGLRARIGAKVRVLPRCSINHGVMLGDNCQIGTASHVGLRARIAAGISLPSGSNIPPGARIQTQQDVERYYSSETKLLNDLREATMRKVFDAENPQV